MADSKTRFGDDKILVPKDRVFSRGQGCWNCKNSCTATAFWTERRKTKLLFLKQLLEQSNQKSSPAIDKLSNEIDTIDHSVAARALLRCTVGLTATGEPVGDLVAHNYLCGKWSGAQGASLAREGKLDDLPEELADKLDGNLSGLDDIINKKLIDDN